MTTSTKTNDLRKAQHGSMQTKTAVRRLRALRREAERRVLRRARAAAVKDGLHSGRPQLFGCPAREVQAGGA